MSLDTGSALGAAGLGMGLGAPGREVGGGSVGMLGQRESVARLESILVLVKHLGEGPGVCHLLPLSDLVGTLQYRPWP